MAKKIRPVTTSSATSTRPRAGATTKSTRANNHKTPQAKAKPSIPTLDPNLDPIKAREAIPIIADQKKWNRDMAVARKTFEALKEYDLPASGTQASPKFDYVLGACEEINPKLTVDQIALTSCLLATDPTSNYSSLPDGFTHPDGLHTDQNIKIAMLFASTQILGAKNIRDIEILKGWKTLKTKGFKQLLNIGFPKVLETTFKNYSSGINPILRPWIALNNNKWKVENSEEVAENAMAWYLLHGIEVVNSDGSFNVKAFQEKHKPTNKLDGDSLNIARLIDSCPHAKNILEALRLGNKKLKEAGLVKTDLIGIREDQIAPWEFQHNGMRDGEYGKKLARLEMAIKLHRLGLGELTIDENTATLSFTKQDLLDFYDNPAINNGKHLTYLFRKEFSTAYNIFCRKGVDLALELMLGEAPTTTGGNRESVASLPSENYELRLELVNAGEITVKHGEVTAYKELSPGTRRIPNTLRIERPITLDKLTAALSGVTYNPFLQGVQFVRMNESDVRNAITRQTFGINGRAFEKVFDCPDTAEAFCRLVDTTITQNGRGGNSLIHNMFTTNKERQSSRKILLPDDYRLIISSLPETLQDIDFSQCEVARKEIFFLTTQIAKLKGEGRVKDKLKKISENISSDSTTKHRDDIQRILLLENILQHLCVTTILKMAYDRADGKLQIKTAEKSKSLIALDQNKVEASITIASAMEKKVISGQDTREQYRAKSLQALRKQMKVDRPTMQSNLIALRRVIQEKEFKGSIELGENLITRNSFQDEYDAVCSFNGLKEYITDTEMETLVAWQCFQKTSPNGNETKGFLSDFPTGFIVPSHKSFYKDLGILWRYVSLA